jgi:hypothetical protein
MEEYYAYLVLCVIFIFRNIVWLAISFALDVHGSLFRLSDHSAICTPSWLTTSPIFLLPLPVPESESSSPAPISVTSHSTLFVPSALTPIPRRVLLVRPSALPDIISSNQDKSPEVPLLSVFVVALLVDVTALSWSVSAGAAVWVKSSTSISCGRRSRSSSALMSSPSRLPTVTCR